MNHKTILYAVEINDDLDASLKNLLNKINDESVTIHLYHVVKTVVAAFGYTTRYMAGDPTLNIEERLLSKAENKLKEILENNQFKNIHWSIDIADNPKIEIIDKSKEVNADTIYLNGHQHNIIGRLGSVADYIINESDRDVVILK